MSSPLCIDLRDVTKGIMMTIIFFFVRYDAKRFHSVDKQWEDSDNNQCLHYDGENFFFFISVE